MTPVLELANIQKSYHSLRPLRVQALSLAAGERVAVSGLDAGVSEVLVNLVTGASLPDRGEVRVLGRATSEIADGEAWLASLEGFGIVSPRGVLLDAVTIEQNIAMVFTLEIDEIPPAIAEKVATLAGACGIADVRMMTAEAPPEVRTRVHLARAVALAPTLLILEHPTAGLSPAAADALAADVVAVTEARGLAALILTQDERFARAAAHRALKLEPATGALPPLKRGWFR